MTRPGPRTDISGAIDIHCHFGPDPRRGRSVDALELALEARDAGYAAYVLKSHDFPTAPVAALVSAAVPGPRAFGGLCLDDEVGGINPAAVEASLRIGGKVVWMPTHSARLVDRGSAGRPGAVGGTNYGLDEAGEPSVELRAVLDLVAEHGAVIATGHSTRAEHHAIVRAHAATGTVVVTHAREARTQPDLTVAECVELADRGAWIELSAFTCIGVYPSRTVEEIASTIRAVGPDRCVVSTDFGQKRNPRPAAGLQTMADALAGAGFSEQELRRMFCANPATVLGLR